MSNKQKKYEIALRSSAAEYLTYVAAAGDDERSYEMRYEDENIWLTQKMMAALYNVSVQNIGQHIKKVFEDGELVPEAVIKKYFITASDGKDYETMHYNLQMIIAVGFKVNNDHAVQFRKWAGQIVKDYNEILMGAGKISHEQAKLHAETEYEKYRIVQDRLFESDFDRFAALEQSLEGIDGSI